MGRAGYAAGQSASGSKPPVRVSMVHSCHTHRRKIRRMRTGGDLSQSPPERERVWLSEHRIVHGPVELVRRCLETAREIRTRKGDCQSIFQRV